MTAIGTTAPAFFFLKKGASGFRQQRLESRGGVGNVGIHAQIAYQVHDFAVEVERA